MATVKKMKKALDGEELRKGQYKRLGRIAEKNPARAEKVAERMNRKSSRINRGKEIATGSSSLQMSNSFDRRDRELSLKKAEMESMIKNNEMKKGGNVKKYKDGGSLSGLDASNKRVGPVDPKGAYTKVQKKTLAGAKGKASLTKDKQLGATKMKMGGKSKKH